MTAAPAFDVSKAYLDEMSTQGYTTTSIGPFHRHMLPWLLQHYDIDRNSPVLDIGCGQGHTSLPLIEAGWREVHGVDRSDTSFATLSARGLKPVLCDVGTTSLPFPAESFGAVVSFHVVEHLNDTTLYISEARRVLRPGGRFFVVTPDWKKTYLSFWEDPTHVRPYDKVSISRLLRMHQFDVTTHSWAPRYGSGRVRAYRWWPKLGMIGRELLAVAVRT